eukprot:TRINITY_DN75801_c0_g1_i1.p1 TRINITY_DN75801_c0_g1~~TRINITY_DN75801_c0_g1_i1.p1  ORF type:complete len:453 (-),score=85.51 TRINITY_DN75801_c0_g1_i1:75-1433(-)
MAESSALQTPWALLGLHGVQTASSRLWDFAIPLIFVAAEADTESGASLASFNALTQVAKLVALPFVGGLADRAPLPVIIPVAMAGQLAWAASCVLLWSVCRPASGGAAPMNQLLAVVLLGSVADLAREFVSISLDMRVAPAIAAAGPKAGTVAADDAGASTRLAQLNSLVKRVDLAAKFIIPIAFGWLTAAAGGTVGYQVVVAVSMAFAAGAAGVGFSGGLLQLGRLAKIGGSDKKSDDVATGALPTGWAQLKRCLPVAGMSFAFALLFCSILCDHDPITTAWLTTRGVPVSVLGVTKSIGALTGLLGTYIWPRLQNRFGTLKGAAVALWTFVLLLTPVVPSLAWSPYPMLLFITCSRPFLWAFDLAIVSLLQELVPADFRGRAAGAQAVLCQLFEFAISALAVALPGRGQYPLLAAASFCAVFLAGVVFTLATAAHTQKQAKFPVDDYHTA